MVYIDRNGRVLERRPWDLARVMGIFAGLWFMTVQFFSTLLAPFLKQNNENRSNNNARRGGGGGWGGGGGGGGSGPGNGGGPGKGNYPGPNRRIGRIVNSSMDCNIPGGGCGCAQ